MTTYFTKNPLGSSSPYDLFDNSQNFDTAVNSITAAIWRDRFGKDRLSWYGIESLATQSMLKYGYITAKSFELGFTLLTPNTVLQLESNGEYYRWDGDWSQPKVVPPGSTPESAGGVGQGKWVGVGDAALRGDLLKGAIQLRDKMSLRDFVSIKDYGAIGDGTYHPLSEFFATLARAQEVYPFATSLNQSVDWAATQKALLHATRVYAPEGKYVWTDTLDMDGGQSLLGDGMDSWWPGYANFTRDESGTHFLMYGTGARIHEVDGISSCNTGGGVISNPSAGDAYTANSPSPLYSLTDLTNADASGATKATLRKFSVGIRCSGPGGVVLDGFRIVPWFRGQEGYKNTSETGIGDEWDVGIWLENTAASRIRVQSVGYWRIAGGLKTCIHHGQSDVSVGGERDNIDKSIFQGFRGIAVRSYDQFAVTAFTANTIEIPWSASHRFPLSGSIRVQGVDRTYTGLTFSGGKLTFTGVNDTSGVTTTSTVRLAGDSFGMSGTQINETYLSALNHHSRVMATCKGLKTPFTQASACYEISGEPLRAVKLRGCTVITWDDILGFTAAIRDHQRTDTYMESQSCKSAVDGALDIPAGSRLIATRIAGSSASNPVLQTTSLQAFGCTYGPGVDISPRYPGDASTRFLTGTGMYAPREDVDTFKMLPMRQDASEMQSTKDAYITCGVGKSVLVGGETGDANLQSRLGSLNLRSGVRVRMGAASGTDWWIFDATKIAPTDDNIKAVGQPGSRCSVFYAGTGAINTSDGREKTKPLPIDDSVLDAWEGVQVIGYQWLSAIQEKGEDVARWHFGVIAQQVRDAFVACGLDGTRYGLLCYDEWDDKFEPVMGKRTVINSNGEATEEEYETGEKKLILAAGNRWGVRPDQCLFLEAAVTRRRAQRAEERLAAIENRLAKLEDK